MKVVNQVNQTTDYSLFSTLGGNRVVNKLHVERLKQSFQKVYLLSPILVNQKYEIIDGQHRFAAAKALGLPVNFILVNDYGLEEVQLLNTNMKNWKKEDYLQAYCDLGYPEYLKMRDFMREFPDFGIAGAETLLTNNIGGANNKGHIAKLDGEWVGRSKNFQGGELVVEDFEQARENAEKIMMVKPYYDGYNRRTFIVAMMGMFANKEYNHAQFLAKIKATPQSLAHCSNVTQYKILIEDIFNYRSHNKVSLRY